MTTVPESSAPRLFVSAEELGAALGVSGQAVRSAANRRRWGFTRGFRGAMVFSRSQVAAALVDRGVPADDAAEIAASLTGMPKPKLPASGKLAKPVKPARRVTEAASPQTSDWAAPTSSQSPFRTTARSRAAHRESA